MNPSPDNSFARFNVGKFGDLAELGFTRTQVARELDAGTLERIRDSWYARPAADPIFKLAARIGGQITGAFGLKLWGCWTLPDTQLHVVVNHHARTNVPNTVRLSISRRASVTPLLQPPIECAALAINDPFEQALVALDSALHQNLVSVDELEQVLSSTAKGKALLRAVDGEAESGLESLVRYRLRARGVRVRTQVWPDPATRVDLLVGDKLVVECDGAKFHNGLQDRVRDYRRDQRLIALGYIPLHFAYREIVYEWKTVEPLLLTYVREDRHRRWGNRRKAQVLC